MNKLEIKVRKALTQALLNKWKQMKVEDVTHFINTNTERDFATVEVQRWIEEGNDPPFNWGVLRDFFVAHKLEVQIRVREKKR